jgi:hypothetical protein
MKRIAAVLSVFALAAAAPVYAQQAAPAASPPTVAAPAPPAGTMPMDMCHQMMAGTMMSGATEMPMAPNQPMDPKMMAQMMELRGEMMKAMGDVMMKHAKKMQRVPR